MKVCSSVLNHDDKERAKTPREKHGRGEQRGVDERGSIIKNRENRRTVSRVVVRAPTKLDYFSQLLPYLLRALHLPSLHLSLSCSVSSGSVLFSFAFFFVPIRAFPHEFISRLYSRHFSLSRATIFADLH